MTKFIALLTADWHFTLNNWRHRPEINGDAFDSLLQVVRLSQEMEIPIVAAGDLLDNPRPNSRLIADLTQCVCDDGLGESNYFIQGNHDKADPPWMSTLYPSGYSMWEHIDGKTVTLRVPPTSNGSETWTMTTQPICPDAPWVLHGIDHCPTQEQLQAELDGLSIDAKKNNVLVLHQGINGLIPHMSAELFDGMLPDGINLVLCGHIHMETVKHLTSITGTMIPVLSPGSLHLCSIDESPTKQVWALASDGSLWHHPLMTRRVITADFCGATETEVREKSIKIFASLRKSKQRPKAIEVPIIRAVYDTSTAPNVRTIIETAFQNEGLPAHLFWKDKTEKAVKETEAVMDDGINEKYVNSGFDYAKAAFQKIEKNKRVRQLVEEITELDPTQENYDALKSQFLSKGN